jgi:pantetheine-phosphate adenylyltransferase
MTTKLIAVTGNICSGKSTAIQMIMHDMESRSYNNIEFGYVDLDDYCKHLITNDLQVQTNIKEFFYKKFGYIPLSQECYDLGSCFDFIVRKIIAVHSEDKSNQIYFGYLKIFQDKIKEFLARLATSNDYDYILVEASALYGYVEVEYWIDNNYFSKEVENSISNYFDGIINIDLDKEVRLKNAKIRGLNLDHFEIIDLRQSTSFDNHYDVRGTLKNLKNLKLNGSSPTLLQLRGKFESALISLTDFGKDQNFKYISDFFENQVPEILWNGNPYHNKDHTRTVITDMVLRSKDVFASCNLFSAMFHDINYDPRVSEKENLKSACDYARSKLLASRSFTEDFIEIVTDGIETGMTTNLRLKSSDLSHFQRTVPEIIETEKLLMKEFSMFDFHAYKREHNRILRSIQNEDIKPGIDIAVGWLNSFEPNIGWFCGSFSPLHLGHVDVLRKAAEMFDKVVLVQAQNPDKDIFGKLNYDATPGLKNIEIICLDNDESIPEALQKIKYKPTLIRGIRNSQDLLESQNWIRQINVLSTERINLCMIDGDPKYNHISSSFLRQIQGTSEYKKLVY